MRKVILAVVVIVLSTTAAFAQSPRPFQNRASSRLVIMAASMGISHNPYFAASPSAEITGGFRVKTGMVKDPFAAHVIDRSTCRAGWGRQPSRLEMKKLLLTGIAVLLAISAAYAADEELPPVAAPPVQAAPIPPVPPLGWVYGPYTMCGDPPRCSTCVVNVP